MKTAQLATGFDFEPLDDGTVLVEFFGDDGVTFNTQVISLSCLTALPDVALATLVCIKKGKDAAVEFFDRIQEAEEAAPLA